MVPMFRDKHNEKQNDYATRDATTAEHILWESLTAKKTQSVSNHRQFIIYKHIKPTFGYTDSNAETASSAQDQHILSNTAEACTCQTTIKLQIYFYTCNTLDSKSKVAGGTQTHSKRPGQPKTLRDREPIVDQRHYPPESIYRKHAFSARRQSLYSSTLHVFTRDTESTNCRSLKIHGCDDWPLI